jgi:hypothetical protein
MKVSLATFAFLIYAPCLSGQTFSASSVAIMFEVPRQERFFGISNTTVIRISQDETLSAVSEPLKFIVGKTTESVKKANESGRVVAPGAANGQLIAEYEISTPRYYSLIIGINDYQFNSNNLHDLSKAVGDATTLHQTLIGNFTFSEENSTLLINPDRKEILRRLEILAATITPKDNLLIFYAGHGVWDEKIKVGYWLPSDSKANDKSNWISNSTIRDYIGGINSKHTLLIADACFGGSIFKTREANLSDIAMSSLYRLPSRKAMTSGSLSTVPDESKFMEYFIKRLLDTEGKYISARQLFYGLETAVLNNTSTVPQFGVIQDSGDEGGEFIFIRRSK